jgi:hypothetical protein
MNTSGITALSAMMGSLVGGTASVATTWFSEKSKTQREWAHAEMAKRDEVYGAFISECSKLALDSLEKNLAASSGMVTVYALVSRIRLTSSPQVIEAAILAVTQIVEQYFEPNLSLEGIRLRMAVHSRDDPLKKFSEACRLELQQLQRSR